MITAIGKKIRGVIAELPLFFRKFVNRTIRTFVAGLLVMSVAGIYEAGWNALGVALATAALSSAAENSADFFTWLSSILSIDENPPK